MEITINALLIYTLAITSRENGFIFKIEVYSFKKSTIVKVVLISTLNPIPLNILQYLFLLHLF